MYSYQKLKNGILEMSNYKYDFSKCFICDGEMIATTEIFVTYKCKNSCCEYDIEIMVGTVLVELFGGREQEDFFNIRYYEEHSTYPPSCIEQFKEDEKELIEKVKYWRENDRYLMKIIEGI